MFTFITTASLRVAAQLVVGTGAVVRPAATDVEDVTVVTCRDEEAALVVASFRRARQWLDRVNPPRPPRGGTRPTYLTPVTPIVARPVLVAASDHEVGREAAMTPEMESLMRRAQRR